jgi:hypothetical protein
MAALGNQSYSLTIRDIFFDAVSDIPYFATFTKRKSKLFQIQQEDLPYLGVYIMDEQMTPDGDLNAGEVRFIHTLRLGFSAMILNNDPVEAEVKMDQAFQAIMLRLWPDQYIMNRLDTLPYGHPELEHNNPDNVRVEGISRGARRHIWGNSNFTNETPYAEMQYDVSCVFRTSWPPVITDDLLHIHVETVPLRHDGTVPPADEVERIISEYDLEAGP